MTNIVNVSFQVRYSLYTDGLESIKEGWFSVMTIRGIFFNVELFFNKGVSRYKV